MFLSLLLFYLFRRARMDNFFPGNKRKRQSVAAADRRDTRTVLYTRTE